MNRKRLLIVAAILLAAAVLVGAAVWQHSWGQRDARGRLIDGEHFDRIRVGMRREEVQAALGGPPGKYHTRWGLYYYGPSRQTGSYPRVGHEEFWWGDQGAIRVYFTEQGAVGEATFQESGQGSLIDALSDSLRYDLEWLRHVWR